MSPQWTSLIQAGARSEKQCCYHAEIFRNGILACRVSTAGASVTHEVATQAIAVRVRDWIAGYERRGPPSGIVGVMVRAPS